MNGSVVFRGKITVQSIEKTLDVLSPMFCQYQCPKIHFYMDSSGGDIKAAFLLANFLLKCSDSLIMYNIGHVDSAAILPFLSADNRVAKPTATFLMHELQFVYGNDDLEANGSKEKLKLQSEVCDFISSRTHQSKDHWQRMMLIGDAMSASNALDDGIVTDIETIDIPAQSICI